MNELHMLLLSVTASVSTSLVMWVWLRRPLRQLFDQLCDRPGSTDFWSRYALLMLLIAPLSLTVFFSPEPGLGAVDALRRVLLTVLLGNFAAFALVGRSLFLSIRQAAGNPSAGSPT